ncbi:polysaccharide biosynthesis protein [Clostridia bacterium]|nr:polysaccharide biosynthesis protein [Clostridia bacterium]
MKKTGIIESAFILTAAGLITRVMGFVYRIYLSNAAGADGMGLYQMILPVYTLAWSIAASGFTTTISKIAAEDAARKEYRNARRMFYVCVTLSAVLGFLLCGALYFGAEFVAANFFKDERVVLPLKILSAAFPFMAAGSCVRGYFFGMQESRVPAVNQVLEQAVRMAVIYLLAGYFIPRGLAYTCALCVLGIVAEEIFSFVYIAICYKVKFGKTIKDKQAKLRSYRETLRIVGRSAIPLGASRIVSSLLGAVENVLLPAKLAVYAGAGALASFGQMSGMAMPLIYFPSAFLISLSLSLVPVISESVAVKNRAKTEYTVARTVMFALILGIGCSALFMVFCRELGSVIYNQDISQTLFTLGMLCPFLYVQMSVSGVLNGLGEQAFIFRSNLLSSAINIGFIYFLVPLRGMNGFVFGWFTTLLILVCLSLEKLRKTASLRLDVLNWVAKPLMAAFAAALCLRVLIMPSLFGIAGQKLGLAVLLILYAAFYLILIIVTQCVSKTDMLYIRKKMHLA